jgi:hypothetical protein
MTVVIMRDATATDHLVYAWPFPLGPEEIEISCGEDEIVVMCPSWLVGDRLGPGRHRWRTPDPTRPVGAYFVSTAPVETSFDVTTSFVIPATQQTATLRAQGSIIVRCVDPGLLIAQFVGLPFDNVNEGLLRSVTRSSERLIARVLTRRTVMAQSVVAVTDPGMLPSIVEELVAYNPAAGAVFGVEFVRLTGLYITTADVGWNTSQLAAAPDWSGSGSVEAQGSAPRFIPMEPTEQGPGVVSGVVSAKTSDAGVVSGEIGNPPTSPTAPIVSGEDQTLPTSPDPPMPGGLVPPPPAPSSAAAPPVMGSTAPAPPAASSADAKKQLDKVNPRSTLNAAAAVPAPERRAGSNPQIGVNATPTTPPVIPATPAPAIPRANHITQPPPLGAASGAPPPPAPAPTPLPPITPPASAASALEGRKGKATLPSVVPPPGLSSSRAAITPRPKSASVPPPVPPVPTTSDAPPGSTEKDTQKLPRQDGKPGVPVEKKGGPTPSDGVPLPVMGIGMGGMGVGMTRVGDSSPNKITSEDEKAVQGEIVEKLDQGSRVLVPGADGRLVSATIRQEQSGYYELEIGGTGETLWVPRANVVADD